MFYKTQIEPDLRGGLNGNPVITADCIKYLMAFRNKLDHEDVRSSVSILVSLLQHPSIVVHSYAAAALNKLMMVKDETTNVPVLTTHQLESPAAMFSALCAAMSHEGSQENEFVMSVIMRSLCIFDSACMPVMNDLVSFLQAKLDKAIKQPKKPIFNHYLIESFALCIKIVCSNNAQFVNHFESMLFPIFEVVLLQNIEDFQPYAFQIFSLLLEYNPPETITENYVQLFPFLVNINLWEIDANIPGLVRLLLCYLEKSSGDIILNHLDSLIQIFYKLNRSRAMDTFAFTLISAIIIYLPRPSTQKYIKQIFFAIFQRLTKPAMKTSKYLKGFIYFVSNLMICYPPDDIISAVDSIQPDIFKMIVESAILNYLPSIAAESEKKMCLIGMTKLLTQSEHMIRGGYSYLWKGVMSKTIELMSAYRGDGGELWESNLRFSDMDDCKERATALNQLIFVKRKVADPTNGAVPDIRMFMAQQFTEMMQNQAESTRVLLSSLNADDQNSLKMTLNLSF